MTEPLVVQFMMQGAVVGKERARSAIVRTRGGKHLTRHYTPAKTKNYEKAIAMQAKAAMRGREPTAAPIELFLSIFLPIPSSWPKWKQKAAQNGLISATTKPDADNVVKAVKDALNCIVWNDDAQVVEVTARKSYSDEPYIFVQASEIPLTSANVPNRDSVHDSCAAFLKMLENEKAMADSV
ncbi:hypothetical protein A3765_28590 [Oleiphilus sp. HI0130]|nr:hypothetical protein A3765_28875 [Oleiphilus sp. HI0130]KZZ72511.1 hypothetical protein A3765_28590 [Oleiphilus sp. HI0130]